MFPQQLPIKKEKGRKDAPLSTSTASFRSFLPVDSVLWCGGWGFFVLFRARWRTSQHHADCVASESSSADSHGRVSWTLPIQTAGTGCVNLLTRRQLSKWHNGLRLKQAALYQWRFDFSDFLIPTPHYSLLSLTRCNNFSIAADASGHSVLTVYLFYCLHLFCFKIY